MLSFLISHIVWLLVVCITLSSVGCTKKFENIEDIKLAPDSAAKAKISTILGDPWSGSKQLCPKNIAVPLGQFFCSKQCFTVNYKDIERVVYVPFESLMAIYVDTHRLYPCSGYVFRYNLSESDANEAVKSLITLGAPIDGLTTGL